ncbi:hypothetical protein, partial [Burkholderia pseudomallei]|uniref:hypothetical protein n=1 Tax=Burkholderia pseudomallei TaxID=28450 RepID=UPI0027403DD1
MRAAAVRIAVARRAAVAAARLLRLGGLRLRAAVAPRGGLALLRLRLACRARRAIAAAAVGRAEPGAGVAPAPLCRAV